MNPVQKYHTGYKGFHISVLHYLINGDECDTCLGIINDCFAV